MSARSTTPRFEVLDSWRGICALLVALLHFQAYNHLSGVAFFRNSYLFVDFFFVLSGFVIAANYQDRLAHGFGIGRFMLLRFGRLYPLYFVTLMAFVVFEGLQLMIPELGALGSSEPFAAPRQSLDTIVANVLLLQNFGTYDFLTWNTPGWSIATEFWTYLIFAVVVVLAQKRSVQAMLVLLAGGLGFLLVFSEHGMNTTFDFGLIRCVAGFAAGTLAFHIWAGHFSKHLPTKRLGGVLELLTIAAVIAFVTAADQGTLSVLAPIVFAAAVLVFAAESGPVSSFLRKRLFILLGTLSYSIYMVHLFIETQLLNFGKLLQSRLGLEVLSVGQHEGQSVKLLGRTPWEGDLWTALLVVLVIGVSYLTYRFIEVPAREWFRKMASGKKPMSLSMAGAPRGRPASV
jgi:peptidoglycan/LPS O-acetylase OafA/YrhL